MQITTEISTECFTEENTAAALKISPHVDDLSSWLPFLAADPDAQQLKCETMGITSCKSIFRPVHFLCDTFTAEDLKSDNMHKR